MRVSKSSQPTPLSAEASAKVEAKAPEVPTFEVDAFVRAQRDPAKDTGNGSSYGTGFRSSGRR